MKFLADRASHRVIGLMSGTSLDGVDAALCEISGAGRGGLRVRELAAHSTPFSEELRARLLAACDPKGGSTAEVCRLNFLAGELFARCVNELLEKNRIARESVELIGSHGQTIAHLPPGESGTASTLQIGEAAIIAERTGITVVSNFRPRDMAAGGQGAPLVPFVDDLLFAHPEKTRLLLNIGGISNVTYLRAGGRPEETLAFDTGPGNMLIDALVRHFTRGAQSFDCGGAMAASGKVVPGLLEELLRHPFLEKAPPKSTGREDFGAEFAQRLLEKHSALSAAALIATATAFTAAAIGASVRRFLEPKGAVDELIVSGGGALNRTLLGQLRRELPRARVALSDEFGVPLKSKECLAFAILARETALGRPGNLPSATGAGGPRVLGQITPGALAGS